MKLKVNRWTALWKHIQINLQDYLSIKLVLGQFCRLIAFIHILFSSKHKENTVWSSSCGVNSWLCIASSKCYIIDLYTDKKSELPFSSRNYEEKHLHLPSKAPFLSSTSPSSILKHLENDSVFGFMNPYQDSSKLQHRKHLAFSKSTYSALRVKRLGTASIWVQPMTFLVFSEDF